jgi:hypothetical protein
MAVLTLRRHARLVFLALGIAVWVIFITKNEATPSHHWLFLALPKHPVNRCPSRQGFDKNKLDHGSALLLSRLSKKALALSMVAKSWWS